MVTHYRHNVNIAVDKEGSTLDFEFNTVNLSEENLIFLEKRLRQLIRLEEIPEIHLYNRYEWGNLLVWLAAFGRGTQRLTVKDDGIEVQDDEWYFNSTKMPVSYQVRLQYEQFD